jgi:hypothetical protein
MFEIDMLHHLHMQFNVASVVVSSTVHAMLVICVADAASLHYFIVDCPSHVLHPVRYPFLTATAHT